jgi:hypothetical protein
MATTQAPTPQKTSFLKRLFARKPIAQGTTKYRPTRQPDHPKQARQVRKRAWLHGGSPYVPIFFNLDSTGLNHYVCAKLTNARADQIRRSTLKGCVLAKLNHVSQATISRIRHGVRYVA